MIQRCAGSSGEASREHAGQPARKQLKEGRLTETGRWNAIGPAIPQAPAKR